MSEETIFTKIIKGEIPSKTIYKDEQVTAFLDINPRAKHHILIVTNKPIPSIAKSDDADEQLLGHLFVVAKKIAQQIGVAETGYRLIVNVGEGGGQEVPHLHMHLLADPDLKLLGFPTN